jgi:uncharacterized cupin superfamily protein
VSNWAQNGNGDGSDGGSSATAHSLLRTTDRQRSSGIWKVETAVPAFSRPEAHEINQVLAWDAWNAAEAATAHIIEAGDASAVVAPTPARLSVDFALIEVDPIWSAAADTDAELADSFLTQDEVPAESEVAACRKTMLWVELETLWPLLKVYKSPHMYSSSCACFSYLTYAYCTRQEATGRLMVTGASEGSVAFRILQVCYKC